MKGPEALALSKVKDKGTGSQAVADCDDSISVQFQCTPATSADGAAAYDADAVFLNLSCRKRTNLFGV